MSRNAEKAKAGQRIVVLYCQHCIGKEEDVSAEVVGEGLTARLVMMPCSSKVETSYVLKILEQGADGVEVVGCPEESCHFLKGSRMAEKRICYARQLLDQIGVPVERLGFSRKSSLSAEDLIALASVRARLASNSH